MAFIYIQRPIHSYEVILLSIEFYLTSFGLHSVVDRPSEYPNASESFYAILMAGHGMCSQ